MKTDRRTFLEAAFAGALASAIPGLAANAEEAEIGINSTYKLARSKNPPNFVLLFADDLGYADLACYGHPTIRTPRLDRMAAEGVRFTQFYCTAPSCTPSRAALMTGRQQDRMGFGGGVLWGNSNVGIPSYEITIAEALKSKGYASAAIGKWHLGHLEPFLPTQNGFDYYYGVPYSNDMKPEVLMRNNEVIEYPADQSTLTKRYTEEALKFIDRSKDRPFFLFLPYTAPHTPLKVADEFRGKSPRGLYGDSVEEIDWSIGQILDHLAELGLDENTLVTFTSDNGPWLNRGLDGGSAGLLRGGKGSWYEGGIREPFIARWPGKIPPGTVSREVAVTMDLLPTFCHIAGADVPNDRTIDGKNILPLLKGEGESPHNMLLFLRGAQRAGSNRLAAARKGPWKIVVVTKVVNSTPVETIELYNLLTDPSETTDLSAERPEIVEEMLAQAEEFKRDFIWGNLDEAPEGMLEEWKQKYPKSH